MDTNAKQRTSLITEQQRGLPPGSDMRTEYSGNMLEEEIFMGALGAPLSAKTFNLDHRWLGKHCYPSNSSWLEGCD
jgi:hypothetical protein